MLSISTDVLWYQAYATYASLKVSTRWKKPLKLNGKKPVTRQSHVAMLPTFLAAFFTLMQLKCVFAVGKTRKENALSKRAHTKNRLQVLLVTAFRVATKAGVKYRKFNFYCIRASRKQNLKFAKNHFSYVAIPIFNGLQLFAYSGVHTMQNAECITE